MNQRLWKINKQPVQQPVPTVRVGGSSSSGTRAGSGSRANEANTDDRETKRVRFTESRGLKRQGEDVEELAARAEEQHLDADVEVLAHKTWRVEDGVGDAADAAPEQMNIFLDAREQSMNSFVQKARGSNEKVDFMRKQTRWITCSKEIAEVLRGDGRWKRDRRHVHMTGKSETACEYLASLVVALLSAIKRQIISDGAIRVGELHFAGPVPDEGDCPTELEGKW